MGKPPIENRRKKHLLESFSLVNAIFCFTAVYFNIKNRPHHIISKDEAKVRKAS